MNNVTVAIPSNSSQLVYENIIAEEIAFGSVALLSYASILHFPDEIEHIWNRKFTLTSFLYLASRYPTLFCVIFTTLPTASQRACTDLGIVNGFIAVLPLIGVQGLLSLRAYSLCQGYRPMALALSISLLTAVILQLYGLSILSCSVQSYSHITFFIRNAAVVITDALVFIGLIRQTWGVWKLKRSTGLQNNEDLVTVLLRQGILRISFVLFVTVVPFLIASIKPGVIENASANFQNVISSLLICEFTLALRQRNTVKSISNPSALDLALSFRSVQEDPVQSIRTILGRIHESIMDEMGERNDSVDIERDDSGLGESDDPEETA